MIGKNVVLIPIVVFLAFTLRISPLAGVIGVAVGVCGYFVATGVFVESSAYYDLSFLVSAPWNHSPPQDALSVEEEGKLRKGNLGKFPSTLSIASSASSCHLCEQPNCTRSVSSNGRSHVPPWSGLKVSQIVDRAILEFIELTLKTYVDAWYDEISALCLNVHERTQSPRDEKIVEKIVDPSFQLELRYQIRFVTANILKRIQKLDLTDWILQKALPAAISHAEIYSRVRTHFGHNATPDVLEQRVLDYIRPSGSLHRAVYSRDSELQYLRHISDFFASKLTDSSGLSGLGGALSQTGKSPEWAANPQRFIRELCTFAFLLPTVDSVADPFILNKLIILLFDPEPMKVIPDPLSPQVEILRHLTASSPKHVSDSLLQVKLTDIMENPAQLYMFMNYLKASKGPLNQLQFVMAAFLIIQRLTEFVHSTSNGTAIPAGGQQSDETIPDESYGTIESFAASNEGASHLHWEAWELYRNYFHEGAPDEINFSKKIRGDFKVAVESQPEEAIPGLEIALSEAYKEVYHSLQYDHVVPFCQSEDFLKFLSGERPETLLRNGDDRVDGKESKKWNKKKLGGPLSSLQPSASESGFTLVKFRNRLTGIFKTSIEDGTIPSSSPVFSTASTISNNASPTSIGIGQAAFPPISFGIGQGEEAGVGEIDEDLIEFTDLDIEDTLLPESASIGSGGWDYEDCVRDLNQWVVTVPGVEPRRDAGSGKTYYAFIVSVIRRDLGEENPEREWTVDRRYGEFYVLENKLLEFHGEAVIGQHLPAKKAFANKGRAFLQSLRPHFEGFLQVLLGSAVLKGSDLLFRFLKSSEEFTSSTFQDAINPWKAMKKVPGKLSRERGQNLAKFINGFVVSVDPENAKLSAKSKNSPYDVRSESSAQSFALSLSGERNGAKEKVCATIFKNNCDLVLDERSASRGVSTWSGTGLLSAGDVGSTREHQLFGLSSSLYDLLLFTGTRVLHLANWVFLLFVAMRILLRDTVDRIVGRYLRYKLHHALHEQRLVEVIDLLRDVLFYEESTTQTDQERLERTQEAQKAVFHFLDVEIPPGVLWVLGKEHFQEKVAVLFHGLQHPRLNKQLSYVLLDLFLADIFPELEI